MRKSSLILILAFYAVVSSESAATAQAATGGTNDTASPSMVVPIRPRNEPAGTTAVPNVYRSYPRAYQTPNIRLRRIHPIRPDSTRPK